MSVDPASIPLDVIAASREGHVAAGDDRNPWRWAIAAALAALMDDEPVEVDAMDMVTGFSYLMRVRPSDVLAAVLARKAS